MLDSQPHAIAFPATEKAWTQSIGRNSTRPDVFEVSDTGECYDKQFKAGGAYTQSASR